MELTIELDSARELMYEKLAEQLDEDVLDETMKRHIQNKVTELYDNRDNLARAGDDS